MGKGKKRGKKGGEEEKFGCEAIVIDVLVVASFLHA